MKAFLDSRRRLLEAVAVGAAAAAALSLPPLNAGARADYWLNTTLHAAAVRDESQDVLVVTVNDASALDSLAALSTAHGARLFVDDSGPSRGAVQASLAGSAPGATAPLEATLAAPQAQAQTGVRVSPRFASATSAQVVANPSLVTGKVVIAAPPHGGIDGGGSHEVLAAALAGPRATTVAAGAAARSAIWLAALGVLVAVVLRPGLARSASNLLFGASAGVPLVGTASLLLAGAALPVTAPAAMLLATGGALALRRPKGVARAGAEVGEPALLASARRLAAEGRIGQAWLKYRQIPPTAGLLPELYALACELEKSELTAQAGDLFHRIAQADARFRDAAHRLVSCRHTGGTPRPDDTGRAMPASLGRYELLEPIGRGAMGDVYLGRDPRINRLLAIKAVDLAADYEPDDLTAARASFLREAETAGRLSHPNIVTIFDVGESDGLAYIAMEYLKGRHLSDYAKPDRLLPTHIVLDLLARAADALHYAHAQNVVHRDIKPANIMYDSVSETLKITDFGIARLIDVGRTRTGVVLGTPAFMSPEQLEGKNVNGHTDLFALGVSLYELLTGHLPFRGASMTSLMFVIANEPHPSATSVRPDLPSWLDAIFDRALAKDPADRFQTGAEMAAALRAGAAQLA
jgi:serine/threonine-protein kinase